MANNKFQASYWHKDYQICFYPQEQTLRDSDTYSQLVMVWNPDREIVYRREFDTDEIFWSAVETQAKMLAYIKRVINNMEMAL